MAGDPPRNQLRAAVERDLPAYLPNVDVSTLSQHQIAALYTALHGRSRGIGKTARLRSIVGGGYSLRGLLFN